MQPLLSRARYPEDPDLRQLHVHPPSTPQARHKLRSTVKTPPAPFLSRLMSPNPLPLQISTTLTLRSTRAHTAELGPAPLAPWTWPYPMTKTSPSLSRLPEVLVPVGRRIRTRRTAHPLRRLIKRTPKLRPYPARIRARCSTCVIRTWCMASRRHRQSRWSCRPSGGR